MKGVPINIVPVHCGCTEIGISQLNREHESTSMIFEASIKHYCQSRLEARGNCDARHFGSRFHVPVDLSAIEFN